MDIEVEKQNRRNIRAEYSERLRKAHLREGFSYADDAQFVTRPYWPLEPKNNMRPHLWNWENVRALTAEAGEMIGLGKGSGRYDRRVLALTNPGAGDAFTMSGTLFGDIQLIKPGESAPSHRHTPSATRFMLEGQGGWTTVAAERVHVQPGDIVFTGQFPWHDHGNDGTDDFIFLDVLDIPLLQFTATSAWEFNHEVATGSVELKNQPPQAEDYPHALYGKSELRPRFTPTWKRTAKDFAHLRWSESKPTLLEMGSEKGCGYDGIRLELTRPDGTPVGETMSIYTQMLRPKEITLPHRHTSSTIYVCVEGGAEIVIDGQKFVFQEKDIFVVPSWCWHAFQNSAQKPCFIHSVSDRALVNKLNLYREQRMLANGKIEDSGWVGA